MTTRRHSRAVAGVMTPDSSAATSVAALAIDPGSSGVSRMSGRDSAEIAPVDRLRSKNAAPGAVIGGFCADSATAPHHPAQITLAIVARTTPA